MKNKIIDFKDLKNEFSTQGPQSKAIAKKIQALKIKTEQLISKYERIIAKLKPEDSGRQFLIELFQEQPEFAEEILDGEVTANDFKLLLEGSDISGKNFLKHLKDTKILDKYGYVKDTFNKDNNQSLLILLKFIHESQNIKLPFFKFKESVFSIIKQAHHAVPSNQVQCIYLLFDRLAAYLMNTSNSYIYQIESEKTKNNGKKNKYWVRTLRNGDPNQKISRFFTEQIGTNDKGEHLYQVLCKLGDNIFEHRSERRNVTIKTDSNYNKYFELPTKDLLVQKRVYVSGYTRPMIHLSPENLLVKITEDLNDPEFVENPSDHFYKYDIDDKTIAIYLPDIHLSSRYGVGKVGQKLHSLKYTELQKKFADLFFEIGHDNIEIKKLAKIYNDFNQFIYGEKIYINIQSNEEQSFVMQMNNVNYYCSKFIEALNDVSIEEILREGFIEYNRKGGYFKIGTKKLEKMNNEPDYLQAKIKKMLKLRDSFMKMSDSVRENSIHQAMNEATNTYNNKLIKWLDFLLSGSDRDDSDQITPSVEISLDKGVTLIAKVLARPMKNEKTKVTLLFNKSLAKEHLDQYLAGLLVLDIDTNNLFTTAMGNMTVVVNNSLKKIDLILNTDIYNNNNKLMIMTSVGVKEQGWFEENGEKYQLDSFPSYIVTSKNVIPINKQGGSILQEILDIFEKQRFSEANIEKLTKNAMVNHLGKKVSIKEAAINLILNTLSEPLLPFIADLLNAIDYVLAMKEIQKMEKNISTAAEERIVKKLTRYLNYFKQ